MNAPFESCGYGPCDLPALKRGYCNGHYQQAHYGRELKPLRARRSPGSTPFRNDKGEKQCTRCKRWRDESAFHAHPASLDRLFSRCIRCNIEEKHNVAPGEYEAMLLAQNGGCGICHRPPEGKFLAIDHDHNCCPGVYSCGSCIRGLLCDGCNQGIGRLGDSIEVLASAIEYLSKEKSA